jgi:hypothetical protein
MGERRRRATAGDAWYVRAWADQAEPSAVIPTWYWLLSPFAYLSYRAFPEPSYRRDGRQALAILTAVAAMGMR